MPEPIRFLSIDDVFRLHALAIEDQGGDSSLRDRGLLESAMAMPQQQFNDQYVHEGIPAMAAAYAFHICKNHPFVDGNKRAGTAAMIAFLSDNGWAFDADVDEAERVILRLAASEIDKEEWTEWVRKNVHEKPSMELREFFSRLSGPQVKIKFEEFTASGNPKELAPSLLEAAYAMPILDFIVLRIGELEAEGDLEGVESMVSDLSVFLTLYRIAEDMGYEW